MERVSVVFVCVRLWRVKDYVCVFVEFETVLMRDESAERIIASHRECKR